MLSFKFQSDTVKIKDFEIIIINTFNLKPQGGEGLIFQPITRKVLKYVLDVKFQVPEW